MCVNRIGLFLPLAALLVAAAPVQLTPVQPADFETSLKGAISLYDSDRSAEALPILDAMLAQTDVPAERGRIQQLRFFVLAKLDKVVEARQAIEIAVANTEAPTPMILAALFKIRAFMGDMGPAGETLLLIAATDPPTLNTLPSELVTNVMRDARKDSQKAFDLDYGMVVAGWSPPDATLADADWLRLRLVTALVKRGRLDDAKPFVDQIINPVVLVRIGIDRRFQSLWPAIEKRLGPGADVADAVYVETAKTRFDAAPKSLIARLGYAEALNIASREPEAMAVADVAHTTPELSKLNDREIWIVNLHAALLGDAGKIDAALARYAALNATPITGRPGLIGTIINQALFAVSVNRPKDAIAAADFADSDPALLSDYGRLFIAQARACALTQLGQSADAAKVAAPLLVKSGANDDAYLAAVICLGRSDAAAAAIIRRLASDDDRAEMLFDLQPFLIADRTNARDIQQRAALRALKLRPDVKAAYLKAGRDLPAAVSPPR